MDFKKISKWLLLSMCIFVGLGFRTFPEIKGWKLNSSTTVGRKVFVVYTNGSRTVTNNLPSDDALGSAGSTVTVSQMMTSVFNDYNAIQDSQLILVDSNDSDFAANKANHTLTIVDGTAGGLSSGEARPVFTGENITSCEISLTEVAYANAKFFVHLISHEIGHCIGLAHSQETTHSVMSYFLDENTAYRLAIDDKMGITHLYPKVAGYGEEIATMGLSCSRQQ